jgi:hypothetical protein
VVGWRYRDSAWARHRGREAVVGSQKAEATLHGVAGSLVSGHRVELAGCAEDCTFGTYVFRYFSAK